VRAPQTLSDFIFHICSHNIKLVIEEMFTVVETRALIQIIRKTNKYKQEIKLLTLPQPMAHHAFSGRGHTAKIAEHNTGMVLLSDNSIILTLDSIVYFIHAFKTEISN